MELIVALASHSPLLVRTDPKLLCEMNFTFDCGPPLHDIIVKEELVYLGTCVFKLLSFDLRMSLQ